MRLACETSSWQDCVVVYTQVTGAQRSIQPSWLEQPSKKTSSVLLFWQAVVISFSTDCVMASDACKCFAGITWSMDRLAGMDRPIHRANHSVWFRRSRNHYPSRCNHTLYNGAHIRHRMSADSFCFLKSRLLVPDFSFEILHFLKCADKNLAGYYLRCGFISFDSSIIALQGKIFNSIFLFYDCFHRNGQEFQNAVQKKWQKSKNTVLFCKTNIFIDKKTGVDEQKVIEWMKI